jgi:hypothetical protein
MTALKSFSQKMMQGLQQVIQFLSEAVARIFGPSDDQYPETGVQPFEGDIPDQSNSY